MAKSHDDTSENAPVSTEIKSDGELHTPAEQDSTADHVSESEGAVSGNGLSEPGAVFPDIAEPAGIDGYSDSAGGSEKEEAVDVIEAVSDEGGENIEPIDQDVIAESNSSMGKMLEEPGSEPDLEPVDSGDGGAEPTPAERMEVSDTEKQVILSDQDSEYQAAVMADIKKMQDILQDSLSQSHYIASKIDALANDTTDFSTRLAGISRMYEALTLEMESTSSSATTKNILSKTFLIIASFVLISLVVFQVYTFISLIKIQRVQNVTGATLLGNVTSLNTKLSDFDKKFATALEKPVQQEHSQLNPAAPEMTGSDAHGTGDVGSAYVTPVAEKLNRLRNGLPEKKLIRKETGDWFVYNKKGSESIADVEVIKSLNEAYTKIGRSMTTKIPLPAHNAVCLLKPDGKGGTLVVMTGEFIP
ncbi:MAG: hypothetical protein HXX11_19800 [Desulfuromonadales bacterium]|nr:hypothetical protein [Desulfuromonadales bacterium]